MQRKPWLLMLLKSTKDFAEFCEENQTIITEVILTEAATEARKIEIRVWKGLILRKKKMRARHIIK